MLGIQGIYAQEQYVRHHPEHKGYGEVSSEGIEGCVGTVKHYFVHHSNYAPWWLLLGFNYLDLYCVGSVIEDLIDFSRLEREHYQNKLYVYDPIKTPGILKKVERKLPRLSSKILKLIRKIEFRKPKTISKKLRKRLIPLYYRHSRIAELADSPSENDYRIQIEANDYSVETSSDESDSSDDSDRDIDLEEMFPDFNEYVEQRAQNRNVQRRSRLSIFRGIRNDYNYIRNRG